MAAISGLLWLKALMSRFEYPADHAMGDLIDGKAIANAVRAELRPRLDRLRDRGIVPGLAAILVGDNPASQVYVRMKGKACGEIGMAHWTITLPADVAEPTLVEEIDRLNRDPRVHGVLVQQPLPNQIRTLQAVSAVNPAKDVDCFHPENVGLVLIGAPRFAPATPAGVVELLHRTGHAPDGKDVVIVGRSNIVGKPLAALLMQKVRGANATVTLAHSGTRALSAHTRRADILVAAIGSPRAIRADMVGEGAVVIDVGINRVSDPAAKGGYRTVGDVDFDAVRPKVRAITPVPGGVGPMTIAMLLSNTVKAAELAAPP
jgi:methylenetetrahydrofolate dehydrogenase (NADP+)/methenyltetrahydrofolate cyclohydrolase